MPTRIVQYIWSYLVGANQWMSTYDSVWNTERGSVFVDSWTLSHDAEKEIYHAKSGKKNGTFMPLR